MVVMEDNLPHKSTPPYVSIATYKVMWKKKGNKMCLRVDLSTYVSKIQMKLVFK